MKRFNLTTFSFGLTCGLVIGFALTVGFLVDPKLEEIDQQAKNIQFYTDLLFKQGQTLNEVNSDLEAARNDRDIYFQWYLDAETKNVPIIQEVPVPYNQEVIKWQVYTPPPRQFSSLEELQNWLAKDDTEKLWWVGDHKATCVDFSLTLQSNAYKDGYLLSSQVGYLFGENHMFNSAILVNEDLYWIEPQEDRVWFGFHAEN